MADRRVRRIPLGALTIGVLAFLLPACKTPGGPPPPWVRSPDTGSTNVTMRPAFDGERRRHLLYQRLCRCELCPRALWPPCSCRHAGFIRPVSTDRHGRTRETWSRIERPPHAGVDPSSVSERLRQISVAAHELAANLPAVELHTSPWLPWTIRIRERISRSRSRSSGRGRWGNRSTRARFVSESSELARSLERGTSPGFEGSREFASSLSATGAAKRRHVSLASSTSPRCTATGKTWSPIPRLTR